MPPMIVGIIRGEFKVCKTVKNGCVDRLAMKASEFVDVFEEALVRKEWRGFNEPGDLVFKAGRLVLGALW